MQKHLVSQGLKEINAGMDLECMFMEDIMCIQLQRSMTETAYFLIIPSHWHDFYIAIPTKHISTN